MSIHSGDFCIFLVIAIHWKHTIVGHFMAEMTAQKAAEWGKTLDFPAVWAALMKSQTQIDQLGERIDRVNT
ncbi:MAG: hypothetical protein LBQ69_06680 [Treponema sp.]|jgi:hypothetical protein|nr:hypothetical protein [Treponema sp.]